MSEKQELLNSALTFLSLNEASSSNSTNGVNQKFHSLKMENNVISRDIPAHCVPEKIIICVDTCLDDKENPSPFKTADDCNYNTLFMMKRIVEVFVSSKNFMDRKHEFSLVALEKKGVRWLQDFTANPMVIIRRVNEINFTCDQEEEYDLSALLDEVWKTVPIPIKSKDVNDTPPYVVRMILLYNRSYAVPVVKKPFHELLESPYFIMDVIATYDESADKNKLKEVLKNLKIDEKGYSYNFWVRRDTKMLYEAMGKLLAHPLQRIIQTDNLSYILQISDRED